MDKELSLYYVPIYGISCSIFENKALSTESCPISNFWEKMSDL